MLALALELRCRVEAVPADAWIIHQDGSSYEPSGDDMVRRAVEAAVEETHLALGAQVGDPDRGGLGEPAPDDAVVDPAAFPRIFRHQHVLVVLHEGLADVRRGAAGGHLDRALVPGQTLPFGMQVGRAGAHGVVQEVLAGERVLEVGGRVGVLPGRSGDGTARLRQWSMLDLGHRVVAQGPVIQDRFLVGAVGEVGLVVAVVEQLDALILQEDEFLADDAAPVAASAGATGRDRSAAGAKVRTCWYRCRWAPR